LLPYGISVDVFMWISTYSYTSVQGRLTPPKKSLQMGSALPPSFY
jgi:hypothetical protein